MVLKSPSRFISINVIRLLHRLFVKLAVWTMPKGHTSIPIHMPHPNESTSLTNAVDGLLSMTERLQVRLNEHDRMLNDMLRPTNVVPVSFTGLSQTVNEHNVDEYVHPNVVVMESDMTHAVADIRGLATFTNMLDEQGEPGIAYVNQGNENKPSTSASKIFRNSRIEGRPSEEGDRRLEPHL